ncbi:unnamed protein product [Ranitomeya imitator]|uniref:Uncharacterized protein n=1 Tax=Ranitomeya imitator TaxID=111125 RepID=A0ABN9M3V5_9NEOB|nr:unnamed protein product [Ranitomeya imitator]
MEQGYKPAINTPLMTTTLIIHHTSKNAVPDSNQTLCGLSRLGCLVIRTRVVSLIMPSSTPASCCILLLPAQVQLVTHPATMLIYSGLFKQRPTDSTTTSTANESTANKSADIEDHSKGECRTNHAGNSQLCSNMSGRRLEDVPTVDHLPEYNSSKVTTTQATASNSLSSHRSSVMLCPTTKKPMIRPSVSTSVLKSSIASIKKEPDDASVEEPQLDCTTATTTTERSLENAFIMSSSSSSEDRPGPERAGWESKTSSSTAAEADQEQPAHVRVARRRVPDRDEDLLDNDLLISLVEERVPWWDTRVQQHSGHPAAVE